MIRVGHTDVCSSPLIHVYSDLLDTSKVWYILNHDICKNPPRWKESQIFEYFKDQICYVDHAHLQVYDSGERLDVSALPKYKNKEVVI